MEILITAGAFESLNRNRAQLLASIDMLLKHSHQMADVRASGQANIFGEAHASSRPAMPDVKTWDELTRLQHEFQALGFYLSAHPLENYRRILERMSVTMASMVATRQRALGPSRFKLAGIVLAKQERTSKQGNRFAFVQLSDTCGAFEITVFSELLAARRDCLEVGQAVLVEVDAQSDNRQSGTQDSQKGGELRFIARTIEPLANATERASQGMRIRLYEASAVTGIEKYLATLPPGRSKVIFQLDLDDGEEVEMELPGGWHLTEAIKSEMRQIGAGLEIEEY
jgi:DNA polymerase-3 subunit alpha